MDLQPRLLIIVDEATENPHHPGQSLLTLNERMALVLAIMDTIDDYGIIIPHDHQFALTVLACN
jgi:hypothetical protein